MTRRPCGSRRFNAHRFDFNGDGKSDIMWTNAITQETDMWEMNGENMVGNAELLRSTAWAPSASLLHGG